MSPALVVLWLGAADARPSFEADLDAFARARMVALSEPGPTSLRPVRYDAHAADEIESFLEQARIAAASLDAPAALARADDAERVLRAHPELPQSAWLMAERLYVESAVRRTLDGEQARAGELAARAEALEGATLAGVLFAE